MKHLIALMHIYQYTHWRGPHELSLAATAIFAACIAAILHCCAHTCCCLGHQFCFMHGTSVMSVHTCSAAMW
jgi:hypothetical protein